MDEIHERLKQMGPDLVVFDKDGTLVDFHSLWVSWIVALAGALEEETSLSVAGPLFEAMQCDPGSGRLSPQGVLATTPPAQLFLVARGVIEREGIAPDEAGRLVASVWPRAREAMTLRPVMDLVRLFSALRSHGAKIAIATSDDRAAATNEMDRLQVRDLVDAFSCADDGIPIKPAPDMLLSLCKQLGVRRDRTAMVGDNVVDLQMGRAAHVALTVGVLTGLANESMLSPFADLVLPSVAGLLL